MHLSTENRMYNAISVYFYRTWRLFTGVEILIASTVATIEYFVIFCTLARSTRSFSMQFKPVRYTAHQFRHFITRGYIRGLCTYIHSAELLLQLLSPLRLRCVGCVCTVRGRPRTGPRCCSDLFNTHVSCLS